MRRTNAATGWPRDPATPPAAYDGPEEIPLEYQYRMVDCDRYVSCYRGYLDDVTEPQTTRPRLIHALEICVTKREQRPPRKHGNIPL